MNWPKEDVLRKSKILLQIYRDVVWAISEKARETQVNACNSFGQELGIALAYLNDFAPLEQQQEFESKVTCLFETKWMIDLVDNAMLKVYNYHTNGKIYFEIVSKSYLTACRYSESELLETLCMERSTFYEKKKEAIMLFGIALWGYAIPEMHGAVAAQTMIDMDKPDFIPTFLRTK